MSLASEGLSKICMRLFEMMSKVQIADLVFLREVPEEVVTLTNRVAQLNENNSKLIKKQSNLELLAIGLSIGLVILTIIIVKQSNKQKNENSNTHIRSKSEIN
jgi:hypothetical protein